MNRDVVGVIKDFIDSLDSENIHKESFEKLAGLYKEFIESTIKKIKPLARENPRLKQDIILFNKIKISSKKSIPVKDRIASFKSKAARIVKSLNAHNILEDAVIEYEGIEKWESGLRKWTKYEKWFDWLLDYGEDSYLATHIAKLSHSSSKGSSIDIRYYSPQQSENGNKYVSTIDPQYIDTAYPDNKYSVISKLYAQKSEDLYIGDLLRESPRKYLYEFTDDQELLDKWSNTISSYIKSENKKSYFLNKQTYFPVDDGQYHLLLPLTSSSLVHAIHLEHQKYFQDDAAKARNQRKENLYSSKEVRSYPNKAYLHVTGSNHSNASSLNGQRGGRIALFSTSPPHWQSSHQSILNKTTVFDADLSYQLKGEITELKKYLVIIKKEQLSMNKPDRNAAVIKKLFAISDAFFDYIELIKQQQMELGWTVSSDLDITQQLLFEPARQDEKANEEKLNKQWLKKLSNDYGRWLSRQLKDKQLQLTTLHSRLWSDQFYSVLREYVAIEEAEQ
jgi:CRISPR-associated protein Csy1